MQKGRLGELFFVGRKHGKGVIYYLIYFSLKISMAGPGLFGLLYPLISSKRSHRFLYLAISSEYFCGSAKYLDLKKLEIIKKSMDFS